MKGNKYRKCWNKIATKTSPYLGWDGETKMREPYPFTHCQKSLPVIASSKLERKKERSGICFVLLPLDLLA